MATDAAIGRTSSGANQTGSVSTSASSPRAKNPTARWAIGEILTTTGVPAPEADGELTTTILALAVGRRSRVASLLSASALASVVASEFDH